MAPQTATMRRHQHTLCTQGAALQFKTQCDTKGAAKGVSCIGCLCCVVKQCTATTLNPSDGTAVAHSAKPEKRRILGSLDP